MSMETGIAERRETVGAGPIEELYVRHAPGALRLAYFLTGDGGLADDLVQEAFVRVAGRFRHRRMPDDFGGYLRRTIINLSISHWRRRRLERASLARTNREPSIAPAHDPGERDELWRELQQLPGRQRAALVLRYYEDLSEREAAEILGCSAKALNQLVVRGISSLRARLGRDDG